MQRFKSYKKIINSSIDSYKVARRFPTFLLDVIDVKYDKVGCTLGAKLVVGQNIMTRSVLC